MSLAGVREEGGEEGWLNHSIMLNFTWFKGKENCDYITAQLSSTVLKTCENEVFQSHNSRIQSRPLGHLPRRHILSRQFLVSHVSRTSSILFNRPELLDSYRYLIQLLSNWSSCSQSQEMPSIDQAKFLSKMPQPNSSHEKPDHQWLRQLDFGHPQFDTTKAPSTSSALIPQATEQISALKISTSHAPTS